MPTKGKSRLAGKWTKGRSETPWLGGYELVENTNRYTGSIFPFVRKFVLSRIPTRGDKKRKSHYFSSWQEAKKKGWIKR